MKKILLILVFLIWANPNLFAVELLILPKGTEIEQYNFSINLLTSGDYEGAESALEEFIKISKDDDLLSKSYFWLAETYYVRENYKDAAKNYLSLYQNHSDNPRAPSSLLKLGISLVKMGQLEQGCASFNELLINYPSAEKKVIERTKIEMRMIKCGSSQIIKAKSDSSGSLAISHENIEDICSTLGNCNNNLKNAITDMLMTPSNSNNALAVTTARMFSRPNWSISSTKMLALDSCSQMGNNKSEFCEVIIFNKRIINKKFATRYKEVLANKTDTQTPTSKVDTASQTHYDIAISHENIEDICSTLGNCTKDLKNTITDILMTPSNSNNALAVTKKRMFSKPNWSVASTKSLASQACSLIGTKGVECEVIIFNKRIINKKFATMYNEVLANKTNTQTQLDKQIVKSETETKASTQVDQIPKIKVDTTAPVLEIVDQIKVTKRSYTILGRVLDDSDVFVEVDGITIPVKNNIFTLNGSSSIGLTKYKIVAFDKWGNETRKNIIVERVMQNISNDVSFEKLKPETLETKYKKNRIALIIGMEEYENMSSANYAQRDAELFIDYVQGAFGVPQSNIKYFINAENEVKFEIKDWLKKNVRKNTEVYVYFSGHGMALNNGQDLYLLTNDTRTQYIRETAFNRNEIFNDIAQYNPKSVTAFLDTCYSGAGRADGEMLLAMAKGLVVVDENRQQLPDNFTLFTAASAQESAWSLPEAKHGTFSYFLMKGMEGEADLNGDKKLTNGELQEYLLDNVGRYAQQQQTPQMIGDPNQVLVRF